MPRMPGNDSAISKKETQRWQSSLQDVTERACRSPHLEGFLFFCPNKQQWAGVCLWEKKHHTRNGLMDVQEDNMVGIAGDGNEAERRGVSLYANLQVCKQSLLLCQRYWMRASSTTFGTLIQHEWGDWWQDGKTVSKQGLKVTDRKLCGADGHHWLWQTGDERRGAGS